MGCEVKAGVAAIATAAILLLIGVLAWSANHYRSEYKEASSRLELANATITDMQTRQRDVAALDAKYTKELADAKAVTDSLRDDVALGAKRLRVAIAANNATSAASVGDGGTAELAEPARQAYYDLRSMIALQDKQLRAAQEYIGTQCLR